MYIYIIHNLAKQAPRTDLQPHVKTWHPTSLYPEGGMSRTIGHDRAFGQWQGVPPKAADSSVAEGTVEATRENQHVTLSFVKDLLACKVERQMVSRVTPVHGQNSLLAVVWAGELLTTAATFDTEPI